MLKQLNHKNIVKYYYTELTPDMSGVDIILEYVPGGSIKSLLTKFGKLDERITSLYTAQILEGLSYLHSHNIIHRDIKGANILIDNDGVIKITDFGASKRMKDRKDSTPKDGNMELSKSLKGSPYWIAPEVANRTGHGFPADVWSVGCIVIEMLTGVPPWSTLTKSIREVFEFITSGKIPPYPKNISANCKDFLDKTLRVNPHERPSIDELLQHPFFKEPLNEDSLAQTLNDNDPLMGANFEMQSNNRSGGATMNQGNMLPNMKISRGPHQMINNPANQFFVPAPPTKKNMKHADTLENMFVQANADDIDNGILSKNMPQPIYGAKENNNPQAGGVRMVANPNGFENIGFPRDTAAVAQKIMPPSHDKQVINSKYANQVREQKEKEDKELQKLRVEKQKKWEEELHRELELFKKGPKAAAGGGGGAFAGADTQSPQNQPMNG